jgi:hypothetical protein
MRGALASVGPPRLWPGRGVRVSVSVNCSGGGPIGKLTRTLTAVTRAYGPLVPRHGA